MFFVSGIEIKIMPHARGAQHRIACAVRSDGVDWWGCKCGLRSKMEDIQSAK